MNIFLAILAAFVAFLLFTQFRIFNASRRLAGRAAPESARHDPRGVVYYFHHPRCGPCRQMGPIMDELAARHPEQVIKVNVAEEVELARSFGVLATPTTLVVKNGVIEKVYLGARSARQVEALLK